MASKYAKEFSIPDGFAPLLKDFTKQVLNAVTVDGMEGDEKSIHEFAYRFFLDKLDTKASGDSSSRLTSSELSEKIMSLFRQADVDNSGSLDHKEFKAIFKTLKSELGLTEKDLRYIMAEADEDGDGLIDYKEFVPVAVGVVEAIYAKQDFQSRARDIKEVSAMEATDALLHGMPREQLVALLSDLFQRADVDGSGYLSRSEFNSCLKEADLGLTRKEINAIMAEIDSDSDGKITYEEFVPLCLEILVQITSEAIQEDMVPTEEREFGQFFQDLFHNADVDETGYLPITTIKNLIVNADLGLTRVQIMAILSEAVEDEYSLVDYKTFANTVAGMIFAMFRQRNITLSDVEDVRKSDDYGTILGYDEATFSDLLRITFNGIDSDNVGKVERNNARTVLRQTFAGITDQQLQTILSIALPDDVGFIEYSDIIIYGFKCLQYLREQELLAAANK